MGTKLSPVGSSQSGNGVKVYRALLTQTGTDNPVATVLENTLGDIPTFGYNQTGSFTISSSDMATGKTFIFIGGKTGTVEDPINIYNIAATLQDTGTATIVTGVTSSDMGTVSVAVSNGVLNLTPIQILVYP